MFFDPGNLNELIELLTRFHWKRLLVRAKLAVFILESRPNYAFPSLSP